VVCEHLPRRWVESSRAQPGDRADADDQRPGLIPDATIVDLALGEERTAALTVLGRNGIRVAVPRRRQTAWLRGRYEDDSYLNERRTFVRYVNAPSSPTTKSISTTWATRRSRSVACAVLTASAAASSQD